MIIHKIRISGFKSIYQPVDIDFDTMEGLWKITGYVGAGKTTIGEAIIFGLFGNVKDKSNIEFIPWGTKKGKVEVWCESKGYDIYIRRELRLQGQSPIEVTIDGEPLTFTNKRNAQEILEKDYYDVSKMTLELLCIISFNNFKSIATLNSADIKSFLDQVFGFYIITQYTNIAKEFKYQSNQQVDELNHGISSIEAQINKINELSNKQFTEGNISEAESKLQELSAQQHDIKQQYNVEYKQRYAVINEHQKQLATVKSLGSALKKDIEFIKKGVCPTCGAPIDQSQLPSKEKEREILLQQYNEINDKLIEERESLQQVTDKYEAQNATILEEMLEFRTLLGKLQEQEAHVNTNNDEIRKLRRKITSIKKNLDAQLGDLSEWDELLSILSTTVRPGIMSYFIPILNKNIAIYMSQLQQPYVVTFDENFRCNVNVFGMDNPVPISSLSTGQLKTIDMTIILGILSVIMHNINFNVMFLDELMSNMDMDLRDMLCEVLRQNCKEGQTLFIISHTDLDDKYFNGSLNVSLEKKDDFRKQSVIKVINNHC